jgi:c-di-GMP-binding flagellar brake protein YcgR
MAFLDTQPAPLGADGEEDPYAAFRVEQPREILALARQLLDTSTPIQLSNPDGANLTTTLWAVDSAAARLTFSADAGDPQTQRLIESDEVTAVGYLDAVKLQFDLHDLVLVHSAQASALQAALPRCAYRFQRRQAYRVRTLERNTPTALLRHPALPEMQLALRVLDVSIGGCALLLPRDTPPIAAGLTLHGVRLALDADTRFNATLRLQHITSINATTHGERLGCELVDLDGAAERALQRYIDQTQKRRRLLAAG